MKQLLTLSLVTLIVFPSFLGSSESLTYRFNRSEIREYIPICTNNLTADKLYARIVESDTEIAYEFLFYWDNQSGYYRFANHNYDWEFIVVYTYPNGTISQVNYDSWHYYIGRTKNPEAHNDTNVLIYVDESFHNFLPDKGMRKGNISWQINNQSVYELTNSIINQAKQEVGFDPELFRDPFSWKEMGWFGRYTAFDSWWKAFWVVTDKKFDFIDLSDNEGWFSQWL